MLYLKELFVSQEARSAGIGGQLLAKMEQHSKDRGATFVCLQTLRDSAAEQFYLSRGFSSAPRIVTLMKTL